VSVGFALIAALVGGYVWLRWPREPRVTIGKNDEVYYYRRATREDALALGQALQRIGFFNDRGSSVLLWMGGGPTILSFAVGDGDWDHLDVVSNFTEIGRRVAHAVGGFPIQVHLIDAQRVVHRKMNVGQVTVGGDFVYYFGDATADDAQALGAGLRAAGYFTGQGVTVSLLKGQGTAISFVVQEGLWDNMTVVATLDKLVRQVAAGVGGLPVKLRMVDRDMTEKRVIVVK
jgi:hypothetical protein